MKSRIRLFWLRLRLKAWAWREKRKQSPYNCVRRCDAQIKYHQERINYRKQKAKLN